MNSYIKITLFASCFVMLASCKNNSTTADTTKTAANTEIVSTDAKWSERLAKSIIHRAPKANQNEQKRNKPWNYKVGLLMTSFEALYSKTKDEAYYDYMLDYAQNVISEDGTIKDYDPNEYNIDHVNAGKFLFFMHKKTGDDRYLKAMQTLRTQLQSHPRTKSGGFWHKKIYPYQMWLDGLYMGSPYYARYNVTFENGDKLDDVVHQFDEVHKHTYDSETGLLFHAWDESKNMAWADKTTGRSPGFWARSMGWYAMAIVDVLDYLPADHPGRERLIGYLGQLAEGLKKHQDPKTGLWWQVPDQPHREGNYLESSSSCMFIYAFHKAVRKGYLSNEYKDIAEKSFEGMISELIKVDDKGIVDVTNVCSSAGLGGNPYRDGSYDYYISEPIKTNNLHGLGPFILAALELDK